jgi:putative endonuclease
MGDQVYCVYIMTNKHHNVLYTGVTSDLRARARMHKTKMVPGFTKKYNVDKLVYFETCEEIIPAIAREKQIKAGSRKKKIELIESLNPEWKDLYDTI